jgi:hypothetical protein
MMMIMVVVVVVPFVLVEIGLEIGPKVAVGLTLTIGRRLRGSAGRIGWTEARPSGRESSSSGAWLGEGEGGGVRPQACKKLRANRPATVAEKLRFPRNRRPLQSSSAD